MTVAFIPLGIMVLGPVLDKVYNTADALLRAIRRA
ncbi:hypothetical protein VPH234P10_0083 [Vibrio phage 234P10]